VLGIGLRLLLFMRAPACHAGYRFPFANRRLPANIDMNRSVYYHAGLTLPEVVSVFDSKWVKQRIALFLLVCYVFGMERSAQGAVLCVESDGHASVEYACRLACENLSRWHDSAGSTVEMERRSDALVPCTSCVDFPLAAATTVNRASSPRLRVADDAFTVVAVSAVANPGVAVLVRALNDLPSHGVLGAASFNSPLRI